MNGPLFGQTGGDTGGARGEDAQTMAAVKNVSFNILSHNSFELLVRPLHLFINGAYSVESYLTVLQMQKVMESCPAKTVLSGTMGFALGGAFGLFMASVCVTTPARNICCT